MKNIKWAKLVEVSFLFLAISLLMLFSPLAGNAQNSSISINLEGTKWQARGNDDGSITVETYTYVFDRQGKVTLFVLSTKGVGLGSRSILNSPSYDPRFNTDPFEREIITTPPTTSSREEFGTYKINGRSIYLDFPAYTISATINRFSGTMKGVLTHKGSNKKEEWVIARASNQNNSSSGNSSQSNITEKNRETVGDILREGRASSNKSSVPADSPLLGTWKYEEYSEAVKNTYFPVGRSLIRSITLIYSQDGVVESISQERVWEVARGKGNWRYIPKNDSSGVVEEYQGNNLDERGSLKWINKNQFEYTVTFHSKDPKAVGNKFVFTRQ